MRGTTSFTNSTNEIRVYLRRQRDAQVTYSFKVCLCNSSALFYQGQEDFILRPSAFTSAGSANYRKILSLQKKLLSKANLITDFCFYLTLAMKYHF